MTTTDERLKSGSKRSESLQPTNVRQFVARTQQTKSDPTVGNASRPKAPALVGHDDDPGPTAA
jgi:hypothetical protein